MPKPTSILVEGDTVWRCSTAERLAFLIDGEAYFRALRDALTRARQSVLILGWVVDSRLRLLRGDDDDGRPPELVDFLVGLLDERPELEIRISCWDHSMIFVFDREFLTRARLAWATPERLHFELDANHAPGASLHEKLIVIDDEVAFIGGMDLGRYRWDTSEHQPDDPRRSTSAGEAYPPMHDIQAVVSGPAARLLGEHARRRWRRLTGEELAAAPAGSDPWPGMVAAELHEVEVGIARTRAQVEELPEVRETERLLHRMVEAASEHVFIENQYLSAKGIGRALAARLAEEDPPEVVAITSKASEGWLEQQSIDALRTRWCRELRDEDHCGRFGAYYPVNAASEQVIVHSKLVVVDDELLYLGSANLANRSMALDTECGLAIEAGDRSDIHDVIAALRRRLVAEHLGTSAARFAEQERRHFFRTALDASAGRARTLEPLPLDGPEIADVMEPIVELADPDQALSFSHLVRELVSTERQDA